MAHAIAMKAVFDTYELLESILLESPPQDILLAANVCKAFRHVIEDSTALSARLLTAPRDLSDLRQPEHWYQPNTTTRKGNALSCFLSQQFEWGTVVIRRLGDLEIVGVLSKGVPSTLTIIDDKIKAVGFMRWKPTVWWVEFQDRAAGVYHIGEVEGRDSPIYRYLDRFYGVKCSKSGSARWCNASRGDKVSGSGKEGTLDVQNWW